MNRYEKGRLVSQIVSGVIHISFSGKDYVIREPDLITKYRCEELYNDKFCEATELGVLTEKDFLEQLKEKGMWSTEEEDEVEQITKDIEEQKVQLYRAYSTFKSREPIRKLLDKTRERESDLLSKKNIFRKISAEGFAETCKYKYFICANITDFQGSPIWEGTDFLKEDSITCDLLLNEYVIAQIPEQTIRELSRTEPWRTLWGIGKSEKGIFNKGSADLSATQKSIISWSRVYDNIYESPECPPDEVIKDDDMLDGWLILQSRKRKQQKSSKASESVVDTKGDEVYLFADNSKDAKRIYDMNNAQGAAVIRARQKQMESLETEDSGGIVPAEKTLDAQMELRNISNEQFINKVRTK
tara:strand:+ start:1194 stop:2264 length:1071 start_codon:yes stop_codon:yes gene_type:complete